MANRRDMSSREFLPGQLQVYSESLRQGKNSPRTSPALKVQWGMRTGELVRWLGAPTWLLTSLCNPSSRESPLLASGTHRHTHEGKTPILKIIKILSHILKAHKQEIGILFDRPSKIQWVGGGSSLIQMWKMSHDSRDITKGFTPSS